MGCELLCSDAAPSELVAQRQGADLERVEARERSIGGQMFPWMAARRRRSGISPTNG
jgi:hypothetical protein